jgi:hypothetical protein
MCHAQAQGWTVYGDQIWCLMQGRTSNLSVGIASALPFRIILPLDIRCLLHFAATGAKNTYWYILCGHDEAMLSESYTLVFLSQYNAHKSHEVCVLEDASIKGIRSHRATISGFHLATQEQHSLHRALYQDPIP